MPAISKTINSNAFAGQETEQAISSDTNILVETEQTILSDTFIGQVTTKAIDSNTSVTNFVEQTIDSDGTVFITTEQTIGSRALINQPVFLFAEAQVDKPITEDLDVETDLDNAVPSAPITLVASDAGLGDSVNLSWTSTAKFFNVFRKDIGPVFTKLNPNVLEDVTTYQAGGLTTGIAVTFVVRAVNGLGQESPNSNEATATPTLNTNLQRFTDPAYEVKINSIVFDDAILANVNIGFGSNFSTATFSLQRDPRPGGNPEIDSPVDVRINGRLVFRGTVSTRSNAVNEGDGLRINYTCNSSIIELIDTTRFSTDIDLTNTTFNILSQSPDGKVQLLNRANANGIVSALGVSGAPSSFPGAVDITDLTPLSAAELVLSKIGNFRVFHDFETGENSAYAFGSKGTATRKFEFGKNIVSFNIQKSDLEKVSRVKVIGAPKQVTRKKILSNLKVGIDPDGRRRLLATVTGKNIRNIQVFGFVREKPIVRFNENVQVTLNDLKNLPESTISIFGRESSFFGTIIENKAEQDAALRPIITRISRFSSQRQAIGTKIFFKGKNSATISINTVPKKWISITRSGSVERSKIGLEGEGKKSVRVLLGYDFFPGTMEVEFTTDSDRPTVEAGSGTPLKSVTDGQFLIVSDSIVGFNNETDILSRMNARAQNELNRLSKDQIGGSITVIGDETVDLRQSVDVSGDVLEISGVTHSFVGGFTTTIQLTNEPFFRTIIVPPALQLLSRSSKELEKSRRLFTESFADRELAQADNSKDRQSEKEETTRKETERGPFAIYQD